MHRKININALEWLLMIISSLILVDAIIILDIPFIREIIPLVFFTFIPGALIISIFRLKGLNFLKKSILSIGISTSFLIFLGLGLNSLYPLLIRPLSLMPVLISLNLSILIFTTLAYYRNRDNFPREYEFNLVSKDKLKSPLVLPVIFPFMAIFGTYLMNNANNNVILLLMLFFIPVYIIIIIYLKDKIDKNVYPFSLWTISLSLLLTYGLTSNHIMGRDIHAEFYVFGLTLKNLHWSLMDYYSPYNACLSITILPVIYKVLSSMNSEYIFKIFFAFIGSFIPLSLYIIFQRYLSDKYAFLASLLFVFQTYFIFITNTTRQEVAFLFFFIAIWIFFDDKFSKLFKKAFFVIFIISTMVSHYTTAYVSMALIFPILLLPFLKSIFNRLKRFKNKQADTKLKMGKFDFSNFDLILLILFFTIIWYIIAAKVQFEIGSAVIGTTISTIQVDQNMVPQTRNDVVLGVLGIGIKSLPNLISVVVNNSIFIMIGLGLIFIIKNYGDYKKKFESSYIFGAILSVLILASFVILPYVSNAYGPQRLFMQLTVFLAPIFIIGSIKFSQIIKRPKLDIFIILLLLLSLFTCGTYLQYHLLGVPYSPLYEKEGSLRGEYYIYDQEVIATSWLKEHRLENMGIQTDYIGFSRVMLGFNTTKVPKINNKTGEGYIYLGYVNVNKKIIYPVIDTPMKLSNFSFLKGRDKIYENGGAQIWK